jgi:prepilin-type N-terminal cleavage/methylation domain-containing protein
MSQVFPNNHSTKSESKTAAQSGFSLIEAMVAMVIFLIVIGSVYGLLQVGLIDRNRASRHSDVLKNARAAIHLIGRDALNAGLGYNKSGALVPDNFISTHLGIPTYADGKRDTLTAVMGGNNIFSNVLLADPNSRTDLIAFAFRDMGFNDGNLITLTGVGPKSGSPAVAVLQTPPNGAQRSRVHDLYLVESQSSQLAVMATSVPNTNNRIEAAPGDPLGLNQALDGTGENRSILKPCAAVEEDECMNYTATAAKKFFWVSYKVNADGTLIRTTYGNNTGAAGSEQIQQMPLAYNIEDFQIKYVLEDGRVTEDPAVGPDGVIGTADDTPLDFNLVRQITVTIKVQGTENDEQLKRPETVTLTSTFSTRNLEYDAG